MDVFFFYSAWHAHVTTYAQTSEQQQTSYVGPMFANLKYKLSPTSSSHTFSFQLLDNVTVSVSAMLGTPAPPSSTTRRRTAITTGNAPPL